MLIDALVFSLVKSGCVQHFWEKLDAQTDASLGIASSARPFMVASRFVYKPQPSLVIVAGEENAYTFTRSLASYIGTQRVFHFPQRRENPFSDQAASASVCARQLQAAHLLASNAPYIVVASAQSLVRLLPSCESKRATPVVLSSNQTLDSLEHFLEMLLDMGYKRAPHADEPGSFSQAGGIIDVFPGQLEYPVQLDFFGDTLEEIRKIVPSTGQTINQLQSVEIYPVRFLAQNTASRMPLMHALKRPARTNQELRRALEALESGIPVPGEDKLLSFAYDTPATLGDYATRLCLTTLIEPRALFDDASRAFEAAQALVAGSQLPVSCFARTPQQVSFGKGVRATYMSLMRAHAHLDDELRILRPDVAGDPEKLFARLHTLLDAGTKIVFSIPHYRARADMKLALVDHELPIYEVNVQDYEADVHDENASDVQDENASDVKNANAAHAQDENGANTQDKHPSDVQDENASSEQAKRALRSNVVNVVASPLPLGMIIPKAKLALISITDTQRYSAKRARQSIDITKVTFPFKPGDYVVHVSHGIAYFKGIVTRENDGDMRDYLQLEYAEGDQLFVPVERLDRVTRYVGPEGNAPRLTRLNSSDWSRAMNAARRATRKLAFDLVDVYTRRQAVQGFAFSADTPWQKEMEDAFPYKETPDQLSAIADVKADMQAARPMDRLICGDVGFGKTEVALRAAFKATQDNKQVMVLCPTTILAQQHYTNFRERFEPFGVHVEVLSRFRTPAQQKRALEGFADGSIEVLVGTHRLLSRDVNPHDLGLIIIDEEQRFGVQHKEQMKNLRAYIDVLTLSATPIPRTLQMSLSGVRDMSLILTPPSHRRAVDVHVGEYDPDMVSMAIARELNRGGQVYYVSNRVHSIDEALARVHEAAGEARVGVAHGQMDRDSLEAVMEEFSAGKLDVLVATTIIESGIDNPHTNTLIIEDAQRLGLSQLYQLKGRVGRSTEQAYALFMFPEHVPLTEEALARLTALKEFQELGSGMRIAMRDLEIRGAGSILGAEQSGNLSQVGFDLFAQMLQEALRVQQAGEDAGQRADGADARAEGIGAIAADGAGAAGGERVAADGAGSRSRTSRTTSRSTSREKPESLQAITHNLVMDVTVNIPGSALLSEEYIPDIDERVMWYRRLACAPTIEFIDKLSHELACKHPDIPDEARALFARARIKVLANDANIKSVIVSEGLLIVDPVRVAASLMADIRRARGRVVGSKLRLPLRYFTLNGATEDDISADKLVFTVENFMRVLCEGARSA